MAAHDLHSHQQCTRAPFLHIITKTFTSWCLIIVIPTDGRWHLIVVLICISLMIHDAEHLFLIPIDYLDVFYGRMSLHHLCPLFNLDIWCFVLLLSYKSSLYILDINPLLDTWFANTFFLFHRLPFHFVGCLLCRSFSVCYSPPPLFLLLLPVLLVSIPKNHCQGQHQGAFHLLPFTL